MNRGYGITDTDREEAAREADNRRRYLNAGPGAFRSPFSDDVQTRYNEDTTFRCVVDMLHSGIRRAQLSPAEVRQAAMLAASTMRCTGRCASRCNREQTP